MPAYDIVVDPLVMPIGAMGTAGLQVFTLVRRLRDELGVNTTCGASNISFGLPNRHGINNAFLPMAMGAGMTSAIMNPIALPVKQAEIEAKKAEVAALGIGLPYMASAFGIFLLRQAFKSVPLELEEAARIEGCSWMGVLWKVYVPAAKPVYLAYALVSVATLALIPI